VKRRRTPQIADGVAARQTKISIDAAARRCLLISGQGRWSVDVKDVAFL